MKQLIVHDHACIQELDDHLPPIVMGSLNGPVPLLLTAATWKLYSVYGVRLSMMTPTVVTDLFCRTLLSAPNVL